MNIEQASLKDEAPAGFSASLELLEKIQGGIKRGEIIIVTAGIGIGRALQERLAASGRALAAMQLSDSTISIMVDESTVSDRAKTLALLKERLAMHDDTYGELLLRLEERPRYDRIILDELAAATLKPKRKGYHSPYYPEHCKARKGKR